MAKSTVFSQKYATCATTNHQLFTKYDKNLVIRIDREVSIK